jgi:hypothetical protein
VVNLPALLARVADEVRRQLRNMKLDRTVRRLPGNEVVALRDFLGPQADRILSRFGLIPAAVRRRRARRFEEDLRLLNDVLAGTAFGDRYWVWGGMLLGWAREGRLLPHDTGDADFCYDAADDELLDRAEPALLAAGFRRWYSFRDNTGVRTERTFIRHGALFEFFRLQPTEQDMQEYHLYGTGPTGLVEAVGLLPRLDLEPFDFLGRTWRKPVDHEKVLELHYGDWRTPDPTWGYLDDNAIVRTREWCPVGSR